MLSTLNDVSTSLWYSTKDVASGFVPTSPHEQFLGLFISLLGKAGKAHTRLWPPRAIGDLPGGPCLVQWCAVFRAAAAVWMQLPKKWGEDLYICIPNSLHWGDVVSYKTLPRVRRKHFKPFMFILINRFINRSIVWIMKQLTDNII